MPTIPRHSGPLLAALTLIVCAGETPTRPDPGASFTVSGTIRNISGATIPPDARVVGAWLVTSGTPDYAYIFGEGTIDRASNRFTLTFHGDVPDEGVNSSGLAVAYIFLTTDATLREGRLPAERDPAARVIGAAEQHGVVCMRALPVDISFPWVTSSPQGYCVGRGITQPNEFFDGFEQVPEDSIELVINDWDKIALVNWT